MYNYKIKNAVFLTTPDSYGSACNFEIGKKTYWLPYSENLKPSFLIKGFVPIYTEGEINSFLLTREEVKPEEFRQLNNLTNDPRLVRLGFIHFLENYYDRVLESRPVPDELSIRELAEFWIVNHYPSIHEYKVWLKVVRKIWNARISN